MYPAALENVIAVGAVDWQYNTDTEMGEFISPIFTSQGLELDFVAPGVNILSTYPKELDIQDGITDGYTLLNGTSMSAPFISGMAALLKAEDFNNRDNENIKALLTGNAISLNNETIYGKGIINGSVDGEVPDIIDFPHASFFTLKIDNNTRHLKIIVYKSNGIVDDTFSGDFKVDINRLYSGMDEGYSYALKPVITTQNLSSTKTTEHIRTETISCVNGMGTLDVDFLSGYYQLVPRPVDNYMNIVNDYMIGLSSSDASVSGTIYTDGTKGPPTTDISLNIYCHSQIGIVIEEIIFPAGEHMITYSFDAVADTNCKVYYSVLTDNDLYLSNGFYTLNGTSENSYDTAFLDMTKGGAADIDLTLLTKEDITDDYGDNMDEACEMEIEQIYTGKLDYFGDRDYFKFTVNEKADYTLCTSTTFPTRINLYTDDGDILKSQHINNDSLSIEIPEMNIGTYYFKIEDETNSKDKHYATVIFESSSKLMPAAFGLKIYYITPRVNEPILGSYSFFDPNGDSEGESLFRWLSSDSIGGPYSAIPGATSTNYQLTANDINKYIKFEVTPISVNDTETGEATSSDPIGPVNPLLTAPSAINVAISGTAKVGNTLTGNYTFSDINGDAEGISIFKWLRSDSLNGTYTVIPGANSKTYTLTNSDEGKYIMFCVTPISTQSPTYGFETFSASVGPVSAKTVSPPSGGGGSSPPSGGGSAPVLPPVITPTTVPTPSPEKEVVDEDGQKKLIIHTDSELVDFSEETPVIDAMVDEEVTVVEVNLDKTIFEESNTSGKAFTIQSNQVSFTIEPDTIDLPVEDANIHISSRQLSLEDLPDLLRNKAQEADEVSLVFDFDLLVNDTEITTLNQPITITVKVDLSKITDKEKVGIYYYNEAEKKWEYVGGKVNDDGTVTFKTKHFSKYTAMQYNKTFGDIANHWAKSDIEIMASKHITKGRGENFVPDVSISRVEYTALLIRALGITEGSEGTPFHDVTSSDWFYSEVCKAYQTGIVSCTINNAYKPEEIISREEMAELAVLAYEYYTGINPDE